MDDNIKAKGRVNASKLGDESKDTKLKVRPRQRSRSKSKKRSTQENTKPEAKVKLGIRGKKLEIPAPLCGDDKIELLFTAYCNWGPEENKKVGVQQKRTLSTLSHPMVQVP